MTTTLMSPVRDGARGCPLPERPPWDPAADPRDAAVLLAVLRAQYPHCPKLSRGGVGGVCPRGCFKRWERGWATLRRLREQHDDDQAEPVAAQASSPVLVAGAQLAMMELLP